MRTFNRLVPYAPILLGLLGPIAACGSSGPTTLVVSGAGFTAVEGKTVKVAVVDVVGNKVVATASGPVSGGKFSFSEDVNPGVTYRVDVFADDDSDGFCQVGVDHVYAVDVQSIADGATFNATVNATRIDSRGCLAFGGSSLHVTLTNFTAGGTVYNAALSPSGKGPVANTQGAISGGTIQFDFPGAIFPHTNYRVDIYIDNVPTDGKCMAGDALFSKSEALAVSLDETDGLTGQMLTLAMDGMTDTASSSICSSF